MQELNWTKIDKFKDSNGDKISDHLKDTKVLLIFLRHLGCTFCKKVVSEFSREFAQDGLEGFKPIFVHMSETGRGEQFFASYGLEGVAHVSDPDQVLYEEFGLKRGTLIEVIGPKVIISGLKDLLKFGIGRLEGDGFQMQGAFILKDKNVAKAFKSKIVSETVDFSKFVRT
jgi:hypothetical protein